MLATKGIMKSLFTKHKEEEEIPRISLLAPPYYKRTKGNPIYINRDSLQFTTPRSAPKPPPPGPPLGPTPGPSKPTHRPVVVRDFGKPPAPATKSRNRTAAAQDSHSGKNGGTAIRPLPTPPSIPPATPLSPFVVPYTQTSYEREQRLRMRPLPPLPAH